MEPRVGRVNAVVPTVKESVEREGDPDAPSTLYVTVYVLGVHWAKRFKLPTRVKACELVYGVPVPNAAVFQPAKV